MSELTGGWRGRSAHVPHGGNARRFLYRLVKRALAVNVSDVSWPGIRVASRERKAHALRTEPYWEWYERGEALRRSRRYEDALANFDRALELRPDYARAWHVRGQTLAELGRYFEAVASYMTALKLEPTNLFTREDRAIALASLRRQRQTTPGGRPPSREPRLSLTRKPAFHGGDGGNDCLEKAA
jgi:tetratricopeptide (TPR) repeat protein